MGCLAIPGVGHNFREMGAHEKGPSSHLSCTAMSSKAVVQKDQLCSQCSTIGNAFSEYRSIFSVLHSCGLCIPLGSINVVLLVSAVLQSHMSPEVKVEDRQEREYWCKPKTNKLTFQILVITEKSIVFLR